MHDVIAAALAEDVGDGDVTTEATVPAGARARATITQKAPGVVYGLAVAEEVFRRLDPDVRAERLADEGGMAAAVRAARERAPGLPLEVEVRDLAETDEALAAGAQRLLLDNMSPDELRAAVEHVAGRAELEASGGITLENLKQIGETG